MVKKGLFIVFEGIDGSGKSLQAEFLFERLKKEKYNVSFIKFPQYENNYWGGQVARYLRGEFGGESMKDPYFPSMLYALDRWESAKKIYNWLKRGCVVVCDRYADSNKIHQIAKLKAKSEKSKVEKWLDVLEYEILKIPKPDTVIYIDMPEKTAFELSGGRDRKYIGKKKDIHEADIKHLRNARKVGLNLCKRCEYFLKINSVENNRLLTPEEIHKKIWSCLTLMLQITN
jgi:dTMP kinase